MNTNPSGAAFFDVVIVGGGPSGLSAALVLGRSRRRVLLVHDGPTRNARAEAAHTVFTRDGTPPAELLRIGREQLVPYGVVLRDERVVGVEQTAAGFAVVFDRSPSVEARKLLLATGVRDVLPDVPGFSELWGTGVFHCPYCHGWEVAGRPLCIYGRGEVAHHLSRLLLGWSDDLVLFTDGPAELSDERRARIAGHGIVIREERVERLAGSNGRLEAVVLEGGEVVPRAGMFFMPAQEPRSDLSSRLGCPFTTDGRVEADAFGRTPVPGVYVAGDMAPGMQQVLAAAASGAMAGATLNNDLLSEDFEGAILEKT